MTEQKTNELLRLDELYSLCALDTPAVERFDRITRLAAHLYNAPIALISLVDQDRQWFKSRRGLNAAETERSISFCTHAIESDEVFIIPDATKDERFADNPLVTGAPHIRTYVGAPLIMSSGMRIGTLCLIYDEPQPTHECDYGALQDIAAIAVDEFEYKRMVRTREESEASLVEAFSVSRANEELFSAIADAVSVGAWEFDPRSMVLHWTPETHAIHEVPPGFQPTLDNGISFYTPDSREIITACVQACLSDGTPFDEELQIDTARGRRLWVRAIGRPIYEGSEVAKIVGAFQDISKIRAERGALEQAVAEKDRAIVSLSSYQAALDKHAIVAITDAKGTITFANHNFCEISGYTSSELIGENHRILNSGTHEKSFFVQMWRTIGKGHSWQGEICNRRKDGSIYWVDTTVVPIQGEDGTPEKFVSIRYDITARKANEADLEKRRLEAEAANTAKSRFLATMSHELRTPMNAVLGMLEATLSTELQDGQRDQLSVAQESAQNLLDLLNNILDLSKLEEGKLTAESIPFSLQDLLREIQSVYEFTAQEKCISFEMAICDSVPQSVMGDPTRLRQIFNNLVGNAIKFTAEGGVRITLTYDEYEGVFKADVFDTGIGIGEDQIPLLFERFSQSDSSMTRRFGGSGLGLAITKQLIDTMKGTMEVESTFGKGSRFGFTLPLPIVESQKATTLPSPSPKQTSEGPITPCTILVVDDNHVNRLVIETLLRPDRHNIYTASDGAEALKLVDQHDFDLILMDIQMPEMDGITATKHIRARKDKKADLPVIALKAHTMAGDREAYLAEGLTDYASKPVDAATLRQKIMEHAFGENTFAVHACAS
ncbi:MAG: ATP-binding protein [Pseudomonadota bacterium]